MTIYWVINIRKSQDIGIEKNVWKISKKAVDFIIFMMYYKQAVAWETCITKQRAYGLWGKKEQQKKFKKVVDKMKTTW